MAIVRFRIVECSIFAHVLLRFVVKNINCYFYTYPKLRS